MFAILTSPKPTRTVLTIFTYSGGVEVKSRLVVLEDKAHNMKILNEVFVLVTLGKSVAIVDARKAEVVRLVDTQAPIQFLAPARP